MRPAEISNESIIEAGLALQEAGRNITGFALRQKIGAGNPSRLKQVWDEHVNSHATTPAEPVAELPIEVAEAMAAVTKELTDRLATLAVELNDKAVKAAERRVTEVVRAAGEQREQAERELADAAQTVDELELKLEERATAFGVLETKLTDANTSNQAQAVELAQLRERLAHAEQGAKQAAEKHTAELARTEQEAKQTAEKHAAELARVRTEADQLRASLDQAHTELATTKAKAQAADESHQEQRKQAAAEAHRIAERMTKAEGERDAARKEAAQAREDAAKLRGQVEAMQEQQNGILRALEARQPKDDKAKK